MRVQDAAHVLGISSGWLRRLEREGRIPPARRDLNGHRRYVQDDVEKIRQVLLQPRKKIGVEAVR